MKFLSITCDPTCAGSGQSLALLLKGLKSNGHEVLAVLPSKGDLSDKLEEYEIKYVINPYIKMNIWPIANSLKDKFLFFPRLIYWRLSDILAYQQLLKTATIFQPDFIHSNVSVIRYGYDVAKKLNINHLWHIREYGDKDFNFKIFPTKTSRQKLLQKSPSICISQQLQTEYQLKKNCKVIYNGIRDYNYAHINETKQPYFLFLGQVTVQKGIFDLMNAYIEYKKNYGLLNLKIVGPIKPEIKDLINNLLYRYDIKKSVELVGAVKNVDDYLSEATALIVPSKYEAFGRVVGEAAFNGCLVIGRNTGGLKEQFDNGYKFTGKEIALRFSNNDELIANLHYVEKMETITKLELIKRAQEYAKENLSTEANIKKTSDFLLKLSSQC